MVCKRYYRRIKKSFVTNLIVSWHLRCKFILGNGGHSCTFGSWGTFIEKIDVGHKTNIGWVCFISTRHQRFAFAQLLYPYMMVCTTFSSSLTTTTFDCSSMKQFIHSACTACMRGLLSSVKQHVKELFNSFYFLTHSAPVLVEFEGIRHVVLARLLRKVEIKKYTVV